MNYQEVINDKKILKLLKEIDCHNDNQFNHGLQHVNNVIENLLKLSKIIDINESDLNDLLTACILHDLGQLEGSQDHYLRSKVKARNYLKGKLNNDIIDKILSAIENHHEKAKIDQLSLFDHLLLFADKTDFTFKRLDKNYLKQNKADYFESHILDVNFMIKKDTLIVKIISDHMIDQEKLASWSYYPKIEKRVEEFAAKLKLEYLIELEIKRG